MKIAVYTIAKNEEQFVERWYNSSSDADYHLIIDTGSTDNTIVKAKQDLGFQYFTGAKRMHCVKISPWRFDDARNFALNYLPDDVDICIALDMDEVLVPGWRKLIEDNWDAELQRLRYNYIWNWNEDGSPGLTYYGDKIHCRHGFRWVNPVHETLAYDLRLGEEKQKFITETLIEHHPDNSKSRSQYFDLLELSVKENPHNDRNAHYYARELMFAGRYEEAIKEFLRHTGLPTARWLPEVAASIRYIGDCYWALGATEIAIHSFQQAAELAPGEREAYVSLAQAHRALGEWYKVIENCNKALAITERPNSYINSQLAWSDWPNQMLNEAKSHVAT